MPTHPTLSLSERERRFVDAFMGPARGNATEAARLAGYAKGSAHVTASRMLRKAKVRTAIEARVKADPLLLEKDAVQRFWSAIVDGRGTYVLLKMRDRLKASELLVRSQGGFSDKLQLEAGKSLEEWLDKAETLWKSKQ